MTVDTSNIYQNMNEFYVTEDIQPTKEGPRYITYIRDLGKPEYSKDLVRYVTKKVATKKTVTRDGKDIETVGYEKRTVSEHYNAPVKDCEILRVRMMDRVAGFGLTVLHYGIHPLECSEMAAGISSGKWSHFHRTGFYRTIFTIASKHADEPREPLSPHTP